MAFGRPNWALAGVFSCRRDRVEPDPSWPFASELFRFGPLHADDLALTVVAGATVLLTLEGMKGLWRARSWSA